ADRDDHDTEHPGHGLRADAEACLQQEIVERITASEGGLSMNRRNFLRASASTILAPLVAPKLKALFDPLRVYAQEAPKGDQLIITKIEPYVMRVQPPPAARGGGPPAGRGGAAGAAGRGAAGAGVEGAGRGYPCVRIETAEGIHG